MLWRKKILEYRRENNDMSNMSSEPTPEIKIGEDYYFSFNNKILYGTAVARLGENQYRIMLFNEDITFRVHKDLLKPIITE